MDTTDLEALEAKVEQVVGLVQQLRTENEALRRQAAAADAERQELRQKIVAARQRLEALLDKLPEDA